MEGSESTHRWIGLPAQTRGRTIREEEYFSNGWYDRPEWSTRRQVLRESLSFVERHHRQLIETAQTNLDRWRKHRVTSSSPVGKVEVYSGDWGEVTAQLTQKWGQCFAVLNMANAYFPGGAYIEGLIAQEENMFRRSDCHFSIDQSTLDDRQQYPQEMTALLEGKSGRVYLDVTSPRVCFRGAEDRSAEDLGYPWLPKTEIFPFYELRAAAVDLRNGGTFNFDETVRRARAQLDTLLAKGVTWAVLSAHGCGAFCNPADRVAQAYKQAISERRGDFNLIAFAIFSAGYGPDNFTPFQSGLSSLIT